MSDIGANRGRDGAYDEILERIEEEMERFVRYWGENRLKWSGLSNFQADSA
ncbi:hypothetical protein [Oceanobacillus sp. J11TS1]|uniref:hypothetical protein n=1 Tax=Oceanobacillus sp. J11TS1 TaxID=2807191 RepID=UPI001BB430E2|nr:hypothetical protein [Oceanobacillus sp. J11TS1]